MLQFGLSTLTLDLSGTLIFNADPKSALLIHERRMSRTATLDGESFLVDLGHTPADNTFKFRCSNLTADDVARLKYFVRNYGGGDDGKGALLLSCKDAVFQGAINGLKADKMPVTFDFLVTKQVA